MREASGKMRPRRAGVAATLALAYGVAFLGAVVMSAPSALADNGPGSLSIVLPAPSGVIAQGPVGAHVSLTGTGTAGDAYAIGYASKDNGCGGGYKVFTDAQSIQAQGNGTFFTTIVWPSDANAVGTQYVLCAHDNTNTNAAPIQSSTIYQVVAAKAPNISARAVDLSTPTPGTPAVSVPTPKAGHYYAGNGVQITGSNFAPSGTQLQVYLAFSNQATPQNLQGATQLSTPDNSPIVSGDGGSFTATVQLPNQTGNFYLLVVSSDHTDQLPPSLQAATKVVLGVQPVVTPTPTPSPSPSPSPTTTTGGTGSTTGNGPGQNTPAVVALGGVSIILFVVGVLLLASTVAGPRPRAPQM